MKTYQEAIEKSAKQCAFARATLNPEKAGRITSNHAWIIGYIYDQDPHFVIRDIDVLMDTRAVSEYVNQVLGYTKEG